MTKFYESESLFSFDFLCSTLPFSRYQLNVEVETEADVFRDWFRFISSDCCELLFSLLLCHLFSCGKNSSNFDWFIISSLSCISIAFRFPRRPHRKSDSRKAAFCLTWFEAWKHCFVCATLCTSGLAPGSETSENRVKSFSQNDFIGSEDGKRPKSAHMIPISPQ